jgi:hypothetical protein
MKMMMPEDDNSTICSFSYIARILYLQSTPRDEASCWRAKLECVRFGVEPVVKSHDCLVPADCSYENTPPLPLPPPTLLTLGWNMGENSTSYREP